MAGVFTARSPDAWTGARAPTRASKAEEGGRQSLKTARNNRVRAREGAGQPSRTQTNRGTAARQPAHACAPGYSAPSSGRLQESSVANDAAPAHLVSER